MTEIIYKVFIFIAIPVIMYGFLKLTGLWEIIQSIRGLL